MFTLSPVAVTRAYEAVVIMHPDATEEEQRNLFTRNKSIIESFSGEINHIDTWGKRRLANPVEKLQKALYFHTTFSASPTAIAELERTMRINDRVIRFVHTRLPEETNLQKFVETFKEGLEESAKREREREAKFQAKRAARQKKFEGGDRGDRGDRGPRRGRHDEGDEGEE